MKVMGSSATPSTANTASDIGNASCRASITNMATATGAIATGMCMSTRLAAASLAKGPNNAVIRAIRTS